MSMIVKIISIRLCLPPVSEQRGNKEHNNIFFHPTCFFLSSYVFFMIVTRLLLFKDAIKIYTLILMNVLGTFLVKKFKINFHKNNFSNLKNINFFQSFICLFKASILIFLIVFFEASKILMGCLL